MGYKMKRGAAPKFRELGSSPAKPGETPNKNVLGGAAQGAKMGSMFGPWGTAIGAVAGGIFGGIKQRKAKAAQMEEEKKNEIVAEALREEEEGKKRASIGYSGFDAESV
jgi:hypothetical protein